MGRILILVACYLLTGCSHKSPEQAEYDRAVAEASAVAKAEVNGDLKSLPDGTYICTVTTEDHLGDGSERVYTSCSNARDDKCFTNCVRKREIE
jgi:hypothetical protein